MSKARKAYRDFTAEEKAAYNSKRDAYWAKRAEDKASAFVQLEAELKKLNASPEVMQLLQRCQKGVKSQKHQNSGYLTQLFGTEEPVAGTTVSYLFVGVRGPNGERLNANETIKDFIGRTGDCIFKHDAISINSMVWYCKRRGYVIENNKDNATVTFVKKVEEQSAPVEKPKAELIKKNTKAA